MPATQTELPEAVATSASVGQQSACEIFSDISASPQYPAVPLMKIDKTKQYFATVEQQVLNGCFCRLLQPLTLYYFTNFFNCIHSQELFGKICLFYYSSSLEATCIEYNTEATRQTTITIREI